MIIIVSIIKVVISQGEGFSNLKWDIIILGFNWVISTVQNMKVTNCLKLHSCDQCYKIQILALLKPFLWKLILILVSLLYFKFQSHFIVINYGWMEWKKEILCFVHKFVLFLLASLMTQDWFRNQQALVCKLTKVTFMKLILPFHLISAILSIVSRPWTTSATCKLEPKNLTKS